MDDRAQLAAERLRAVTESIARTAREEGRDPASVTLIAVSKTFTAEAIEPVLAAGHRVFGENRVQEAKTKWPALKELYRDVELHLIGPLQSNKAHDAVMLFDVIHSLDRPSLAEALKREMDKTGRRPRLFVQVNTGEEAQKSGVAPGEADAFIARCRDVWNLPVVGLMCIPPAHEPPSPHFALLAKMAARNGLSGLSMGMSADFEQAVMLGATHVRVGSAIFGARH
ncbi:YggS family pyridoxal phosphate-dependent enzyme [Chelatococcus sp. XZ-Ab1]|uniref:YggS family pyridoxal phosphate-dependent enzyme n=1 Tax=Chelatococcus sp. XZ-Ab1 TaxID=3034027 RepID=UPI0023E356FB|nr:YggS family pyridoxal phosphate-dependent enzyme [Chelatococcus sp. XZ-Ab1]